MTQFALPDSAMVIVGTFIIHVIGLTATLWVLRPYVEKKQLFVIGFIQIVAFIVINCMRWYTR